MDTLAHDVRFALRGFRRAPAFTIAAALTLALGIGANTAIFSVVNAVLLRPLPYQEPGRLVLVRERIPKIVKEPIPFAPADLVVVQQQNRSFESVAGFQSRQFDIAGSGDPERASLTEASANLFPTLGVTPLMGRTFTDEEDRNRSRVIVLTYKLWKTRYAGDRSVLGKTMWVERKPYTIIGVMPEGFGFPDQGVHMSTPPQAWIPLSLYGDLPKGDNFSYGAVARLKPAVSLDQANQDLHNVAKRILETYPPEIRGELIVDSLAVPLKDDIVGDVRKLLFLLSAAVGALLLIACANVANLLLSRAAGRQKEIAIRVAVGAGRVRIIRQMLTESCVLALAGCALGIVIAVWGVDLLAPALQSAVPRAGGARIDWVVLLFTVALSCATGCVFGLSPALAAWHADPQDRLKDGIKGSAGARRNRLQNAFVISEIAVATVLLTASGLLVRSFLNVQNTNPGFRPESALSFSVSASGTEYRSSSDTKNFFDRVLARVSTTPGVQVAGLASDVPMKGSRWKRLFTPDNVESTKTPVTSYSLVAGKYFEALAIPLRSGRFFAPSDFTDDPRTVIVNETMARRMWPGQNAIGRRVKFGPAKSDVPWVTVVGVVGDVPDDRVDRETMAHIYQPYAGKESLHALNSSMYLVVRGAADPRTLMAALRAQVWSLDKQAPVSEMQTLTKTVAESEAPRRLNTWIMGLFAGTALLLAAIGIYGVIGYSVTQRTQEIGIRMALGAQASGVLGMVIRQGMALALAGIATGVVLSLWLVRFLSSFLYQVQERDAATLAAVSVFLLATVLVASYIPARRAARVDPMNALRYE